MKLGLLLLVPLALAFAPRDARQDAPIEVDDARTITFTSKAPAVGAKYSTTEETSSALSVTTQGRTMKVDTAENEHRLTEVLAVKDGVSRKVRAVYKKHGKETTVDGKAKVETSLVAGKTYVVERKGDDLVVTDDRGRSVSAEEEAQVKKDYKRLGKPDEVTNTLKSKPRKVGERLDDVAKVLADQFKERGSEPGQDITIEETKLVLSSTKKIDGVEHAVLDLTVRMSGGASKAKISMSLGGQVFVRIDEASFGEISASGPITMNGPDASVKGTITLKTKTGP